MLLPDAHTLFVAVRPVPPTEQIGSTASSALRPLLAQLRKWDLAAAQRVDHFIAISSEVQQRIRAIYGRESEVIFPPVDVDYFTPDQAQPVGDYYLVVSRLIPYKRVDLAVEAFRHLPQEKLVVVGDGRDMAALKAAASANVQFLGRLPRAACGSCCAAAAPSCFPV